MSLEISENVHWVRRY